MLADTRGADIPTGTGRSQSYGWREIPSGVTVGLNLSGTGLRSQDRRNASTILSARPRVRVSSIGGRSGTGYMSRFTSRRSGVARRRARRPRTSLANCGIFFGGGTKWSGRGWIWIRTACRSISIRSFRFHAAFCAKASLKRGRSGCGRIGACAGRSGALRLRWSGASKRRRAGGGVSFSE